jgi:hypothetical protein
MRRVVNGCEQSIRRTPLSVSSESHKRNPWGQPIGFANVAANAAGYTQLQTRLRQ